MPYPLLCWMSMVSDKSPALLTFEVQSEYMSRISRQSSPRIPSRYYLRNRQLWSTTSKAFCVSSVVSRRYCLLVFDSRIHSVKITAAFKDEHLLVKPFWSFDCVCSRILLCLVFITCSKTFNRTGVTVISLY